MQTWSQIIDYFTNLNAKYRNSTTQSMLSLVRHLSKEPDMMMVNRAVGMNAQDLLLWVPPASSIVHIQSTEDDGYVIYLDNQDGASFDGQRHYAQFDDVLNTVEALIRRSLR